MLWHACTTDLEVLELTVLQDANYEFRLATDPGVATETGRYFVNGRVTRSPSESYDDKIRKRLWSIMQEQTGAHY